MKKIILFSLATLTSCSVQKTEQADRTNNKLILSEHIAPIKIFGIGRYATNSMILTLIDAQNRYFTIETPSDTSLRIGEVYQSRNN